VDEAKQCTMTVGLLIQDLRPGTLEELTAVLKETERAVAVLWFRHPGEQPSKRLKRFLDQWQNKILYRDVGPPDQDASWLGVVRVLVDFLLKIIHEELEASREIFYERR
jgi:hypothetical protein